MSTIPYVSTPTKPTLLYPLVLFAQSRKKNTADLTGSDMRQFLRWLWKVEPIKNGICVMPKTCKTYWKRKKVPSSIHTKERRQCKSN